MAINWNDYELVLKETSDKECEVTGRSMGGTETFTCPVKDLLENKDLKWTPQGNYDNYGGYQAYHFLFVKVDDEGVHLVVDRSYHQDVVLKPDETWNSGWYDFGSWSYHVSLTLRKIEKQ